MAKKLTKTVVDRLKPPARGQRFVRDGVLTGFAARITAGGAISFVVEKRINGRVVRKTLGRYPALTAEQARIEAQKFLLAVSTGRDPVAEAKAAEARQVTLAEVFNDYIRVRQGLSPRTLHDYRRHMRESFADWQNRPLHTLRKDAIGRRHAHLGERSQARANGAMRLLRALFNFARGQYEDAEGRSLFPENPVERLSHTRAWFPNRRRRTLVEIADLPAWFHAVLALKAEDPAGQAGTVADLLLLLLFTGLRRSEALTLQWSDVDLVQRAIRIRETKNREPLRLPLPPYLFTILSERAKRAVSDYVFPGTGEHGYLIEPRKQMDKVIEQSGVRFTLHDLRRTYITTAESLDIPYYALKQLVNHKIAGDVTAGYIVTNIERLREPMDRIARYLLESGGIAPESKVVNLRRRSA